MAPASGGFEAVRPAPDSRLAPSFPKTPKRSLSVLGKHSPPTAQETGKIQA